MRARRKKHLDKRAELVKEYMPVSKTTEVLGLEEHLRYDVKTVYDLYKNYNPLELEIGCGKGSFILEKAEANPDINYLGVEIQLNVLITAAENAKKKGLKNVKFFNCGAEILPYELPENSIEKLYLNFSCPYPKKQYENHRLTYYAFLNIYKRILKKGATIELKTDNDGFFEYSLSSLEENGFEILFKTDDLHAGDVTGNVMTEYERKFVGLGKNIHKLIAKEK